MTVILSKQQDNKEKIWKTIRALRDFNVEEVSIVVNVAHSIVSRYIFQLYQAGYVRPAGKCKEGNGRKRQLWRLVKNTGPKAPLPCRCLYDPNIDDLAAVKEVKDVA